MTVFDWEESSHSTCNEAQAWKEPQPILSNHTHYTAPGSENWEHDNSGDLHNYSGCHDEMLNAIAVDRGWQEGYDY